MKKSFVKILLAVVFLISLVACNSQTSIVKNPSNFTKKTSLNQFILSDSIEVFDGKGEKVKVLFEAMIDTMVWNKYITDEKISDTFGLNRAATMLTEEARTNCKYQVSFVPLTKQFITVMNASDTMPIVIDEKQSVTAQAESILAHNEGIIAQNGIEFMCSYKFIAANGFGIKSETENLVGWNPKKYNVK